MPHDREARTREERLFSGFISQRRPQKRDHITEGPRESRENTKKSQGKETETEEELKKWKNRPRTTEKWRTNSDQKKKNHPREPASSSSSGAASSPLEAADPVSKLLFPRF